MQVCVTFLNKNLHNCKLFRNFAPDYGILWLIAAKGKDINY